MHWLRYIRRNSSWAANANKGLETELNDGSEGANEVGGEEVGMGEKAEAGDVDDIEVIDDGGGGKRNDGGRTSNRGSIREGKKAGAEKGDGDG